MITYSNIGHFGRLGNQLFQFASTYGIAKKNNYDVAFPIDNTNDVKIENFKDGVNRECVFDVPKAFILNKNILTSKKEILNNIEFEIDEPHFHFSEGYFNIPDNCDLRGYLQSDKYFKHVEHELRELLTFHPHIQDAANSLFPKVDGQTVSIHIRRGDYVNLQQFHPPCAVEYYINASSIIAYQDTFFIIFSDDVPYCKELFGNQDNILYINNEDPYIDLCLMSMCNHNIIANSSFSWWAAWLNKNKDKRVIAPKQWFGPAYNHDTKDLYCENWFII
jgi:hypothetical protein